MFIYCLFAGTNCTFRHDVANCIIKMSDTELQLQATINTCNNPLDITFSVQVCYTLHVITP